MRISTSQIYDAGSRGILGSQSGLYRIQNQISSGRKFLSAQDDPVAAAQVLLLGGRPLGEPIMVWWNFVARTHEEIQQAADDWNAGQRFGTVREGSNAHRLTPPSLDGVHLRPS